MVAVVVSWLQRSTCMDQTTHGCTRGRVSVEQWQRDSENGTLTEVFACGTAAVITPVGTVKRTGAEWQQSAGEPGEVTLRLRAALLDIQRGDSVDKHGWMHPLG
jgi:branched-chain amino acid aminotransferase